MELLNVGGQCKNCTTEKKPSWNYGTKEARATLEIKQKKVFRQTIGNI